VAEAAVELENAEAEAEDAPRVERVEEGCGEGVHGEG
jgi:hypothetical protein